MRILGIFAAMATIAVPATVAQTAWQRYTQPTGLTAEFPAEPERFDGRNESVKGRLIQLKRTMRAASYDFEADFFLQAIIADKPYNVDAKLKEFAAARGSATSGEEMTSHRSLRPEEMPLPGMRGVEIVRTYGSFGESGTQVAYSRSMIVGNKWLTYSVRHYKSDKRWSHDRFFKSIGWKP